MRVENGAALVFHACSVVAMSLIMITCYRTMSLVGLSDMAPTLLYVYEPDMYPVGTALMLASPERDRIQNGVVVVFKPGNSFVKNERHPYIVSRVIRTITWNATEDAYVTKADARHVDDVPLYAQGRDCILRDDLIGVVVNHVPHLGHFVRFVVENWYACRGASIAIVVAGSFFL